jgi:uncharacterized membrane protein YphA (DoxX/SURF4 family)
MNIALWILQGLLGFMLLAGGFTKAFKFEHMANAPANRALSLGAWKLVGLLEIALAVLLVVPLTAPFAAAAIAVENLALSLVFARVSTKLGAANPLTYSAIITVVAALIAAGRLIGLS